MPALCGLVNLFPWHREFFVDARELDDCVFRAAFHDHLSRLSVRHNRRGSNEDGLTLSLNQVGHWGEDSPVWFRVA